jgi:hypothetical protein
MEEDITVSVTSVVSLLLLVFTALLRSLAHPQYQASSVLVPSTQEVLSPAFSSLTAPSLRPFALVFPRPLHSIGRLRGPTPRLSRNSACVPTQAALLRPPVTLGP